MIDDYERELPVENSSLNNDDYIKQTKAKIQHSLSINQEEKLAPLATK
jgi:hypothetical protein